MTERVAYTVEAHGHVYTLTKPSPGGDGSSVYMGGGRLDADLARGLPYEARLLEEIRELGLAGVAVDVGAHVGNHTLWLAVICGMRVAAFEPDVTAYTWLSRNVAGNQLRSRVTTYPVALGAQATRGDWDHRTKGVLRPDVLGSVPIHVLDAYALEHVSVIKIDVEGHEPDVLRGATRTLQRWRPVVYAEGISKASRRRVGAVLEPLGYRLDHVVATSSPMGCWTP